jgi:hypothetical protein
MGSLLARVGFECRPNVNNSYLDFETRARQRPTPSAGPIRSLRTTID